MSAHRCTSKRAPNTQPIAVKKRRQSIESPPSSVSVALDNEKVHASAFHVACVDNSEQRKEECPHDQDLQLTLKAISDTEASLLDFRKVAQQQFSTVAAHIAELKTSLDGAIARLQVSEHSLSQQSSDLVRARAELVVAEQALAQEIAAKDQCEAERNACSTEKNECEDMIHFELALVKDGTTMFKNGVFERPDDPKHAAALLPLLATLKLEDSLLEAFPNAAIKPPSARSSFAKMVVEEVEKGILGHISVLNSKLESSVEALAGHDQGIQVATESKVSVTQALKIALQRHETAEVVQASLQSAKANAGRQLEQAIESTASFEQSVEAVRKSAIEFQQTHLAEFLQLRKQFVPEVSKQDIDLIAAAAGS